MGKGNTKRHKTGIILAPSGKNSSFTLNELDKIPKPLDEDEADYQYSIAAIRAGGKPIPLTKVLKEYGRR